jgi:L,D-transpeptidase YbiS
MKCSPRIVVSIDRQELALLDGESVLRRYAISSSKRGVGFQEGSHRTPTGRFSIREMIGDQQPAGTIFIGRRPVGIWSPGQVTEKDLILTRILRLDGLDPANANSWDRYIYIHGTNQESLLGSPASMGCIRMANADIIELFQLVTDGTTVEITPPTGRKHRLTGETELKSLKKIKSAKSTLHVTRRSQTTYTGRVMASKTASKRGKRYTAAEKKKILDFVAAVNSKKGRGGQKTASRSSAFLHSRSPTG